MQRLIKDASKMKNIQKELGITVDANSMSFGNIVNAISVMQKKMDIAGTTAEEATKTLTGSLSMLKASWNNFLSGVGGLDKVVKSARIAFDNLLRITKEAVPYIISEFSKSLPEILELGKEIIKQISQGIVNNISSIGSATVTILQQIFNALISAFPKILQYGVEKNLLKNIKATGVVYSSLLFI